MRVPWMCARMRAPCTGCCRTASYSSFVSSPGLFRIASGTRIADLLPGIRHHHERWDGTGYPDALAGEAIPLAGRIIAVADFLDALGSNRTYQVALPMDDVVQRAQSRAGTWFDPRVLAAVVALYARGELV